MTRLLGALVVIVGLLFALAVGAVVIDGGVGATPVVPGLI